MCTQNKFFSRTLAMLMASSMPISSWAAPTGHSVQEGSVSVEYAGNKTNIYQSSHKAIINWDQFNIGEHEYTQFYQPSTSAIALNRVTGGSASQIMGRLTANGNVWILNSKGVLFGPNAKVDVGGLLASTHNISNVDFMNNRFKFSPLEGMGSVINQGQITIADGGLAALVAPTVRNSGIIQAKLGKVALSAGESFTLDFYGDGLIQFAVDEAVAQPLEVENSGAIKADGGVVLLSTQDVKDTLTSVIDTSGIIEAGGLQEKDGKITLLGGENSFALVDGSLDVDGIQSGVAGAVDVLADEVVLSENAEIKASGINGGGNVRIGGDYQGTGDVKTATNVFMDAGSSIQANATVDGQGGRVILWADDNMWFEGYVEAKGAGAGSGGFVEVSGKEKLYYRGFADLTAENGQLGQLLLDPENITITSLAFDPTNIANLALWLDAEQSVTGNPVSNWADLATSIGGSNNASQGSSGNRPIIQIGALSGRDVIEFDGVNDILDVSNNGSINTSDQNARSMTVSFRTGADVSAGQMIYEEGGGTNGTSFYIEGGNLYVGAWSNSNSQGNHFFAGTVSANETYVATLVWDNVTTNTVRGYLNGDQLGSNVISGTLKAHSGGIAFGNDDNTRIYNGDTSTGNREFGGQLGEFVLYNTAMTDVERQNLEQYMSLKWSPTLSAPGQDYTFSLETLEAQLPAANLTLMAEDHITIADIADDSLDLAMTSLGSITFIADNDGDGVGTISMDVSDRIVTQGGMVAMTGANINIQDILTNGGDINLTASDSMSFNDLNAGTGDINLRVDSNSSNASTLTAGTATADAITYTGGTDNNDVANINGDVNAGAGGFQLINFLTTNMNADLVSTGGDVTLDADVNLITDVSVQSNNGDITFNHVVDGDQALVLNAGLGDVDLQGAVGSSTDLTQLDITANQANVENVDTTGDQNYDAALHLDGVLTTATGDLNVNNGLNLQGSSGLTATTGNVNVTGDVNGLAGLTLNALLGQVNVTGAVGNTQALTTLSVQANQSSFNDITTLGAQSFSGAVSLNGDMQTSGGSIDFAGAVTLMNNVNFTSSGGDITFADTLDGSFDVNFDAGAGDIQFQDSVGASVRLNNMVVVNANDVNFDADASVQTFTQQAGAGATNFGVNGLDIAGAAQLTLNEALGRIDALSLDIVSADQVVLNGQINALTGEFAAEAVNFTPTGFESGIHTYNGFALPHVYVDLTPVINEAVKASSAATSGALGGSSSASGVRQRSVKLSNGDSYFNLTPSDMLEAYKDSKEAIVRDPFANDYRLIRVEQGVEDEYRDVGYFFDDFWEHLEQYRGY